MLLLLLISVVIADDENPPASKDGAAERDRTNVSPTTCRFIDPKLKISLPLLLALLALFLVDDEDDCAVALDARKLGENPGGGSDFCCV